MKRYLILSIFPLLGLIGMLIVLANTQDKAEQQANTIRNLPTPAPLLVTFEPTVTTRPILDNTPPEATLTTFDGEAFTLTDYIGQIVVLNFWATWCPPCINEMPLLNQYALEHPDIPIISVTNPDDGQSMEQIQEFVTQYGLDQLAFGLDERNYLQLGMRALNLPTTFILDQQGIVRFRQIGEVTVDDLNYYLGELQ